MDDFKQKYGVCFEDYQSAAKAGKRYGEMLGDEQESFSRIFFNNIVNGCKAHGRPAKDVFKQIIDELQQRIDGPQPNDEADAELRCGCHMDPGAYCEFYEKGRCKCRNA